jgi:hypothetical protein
MTMDILSKYSQSPYTLIGLELNDDHELTLVNAKNSNPIKQIFTNINDCENFIMKQSKDEKTVLIISGYILSDELTKIQNYSQIDSIYLYPKSDDSNKEISCIYKKAQERRYLMTFVNLLKEFWILLALAFTSLLAYLFPNVGASDGPLYAEYSIKLGSVILILLLSSLSITTRDLWKEMRNIRLHLCIQFFCLILVPFSIFGVVLLLAKTSMNKILLNGLLLLACTPMGLTVNVSIPIINETIFIENSIETKQPVGYSSVL